MIVKLVEVCQAMSVSSSGGYTLREVFINPEHVVLNRGSNGLDLIVVGSPSIVEKKLKMSRQLIRG